MKTVARAALPTLTRHLLAWALGALVLVWGVFIVMGYTTGELEADELTDGHLASVSSLLLPLAAEGLGQRRVPAASLSELKAHDYQQSMSVVVWDARGQLMSHTGDAPLPRFDSAEGFSTLHLGQPPRPWRAFTRWDEGRTRKLMVLLSQGERDDLAQDIAQQVIEPGLWLLPVVALVLGLAIHRGLRPLRTLAEEVHALDVQQPKPLRAPANYEELAATEEAINRLVERYHAALTRERDLADEFAHELRTPLASLALQTRAAADAAPGAAQQSALASVRADALRAGAVLSHLLALARASRAELDEAAQPLDLDEVARRLVGEYAPAAHAAGSDLGLSSPGHFPLAGHALLLELALRNLIENALAHTPPGTQVEVELDPAARWLQVSDDGPAREGAATASTQSGLQPLKLGLGHRVVEKVASLHGAGFEPAIALPGGRRGWRLVFPPEPAPVQA
ncbi:two-component sensor histidine kinase [Ramlibacter sp. XY19]|uniref:histidine kinase dimerization/phospho-acceptor domain-containing protein n=1 Tax=Ramlibacter paludis TaxID=2908000 RepID=UPI0023DC9E7A|nr:histidine kinase dimerization/phospho-acceptor domain-containing protein [Ramlibacter paludis]MCG2591630.1 two-component sensor histidine kinase [Ramlibacter paludis]